MRHDEYSRVVVLAEHFRGQQTTHLTYWLNMIKLISLRVFNLTRCYSRYFCYATRRSLRFLLDRLNCVEMLFTLNTFVF